MMCVPSQEAPQAHPLNEELQWPEESHHGEQACGGQDHTVDLATDCGQLQEVSELPDFFTQFCMNVLVPGTLCILLQVHGSHGQE